MILNFGYRCHFQLALMRPPTDADSKHHILSSSAMTLVTFWGRKHRAGSKLHLNNYVCKHMFYILYRAIEPIWSYQFCFINKRIKPFILYRIINRWWNQRPEVHVSLETSSARLFTLTDIFRVTGHLCGEFTGHQWIPRTKAIHAELWCFLWSAPEYTFE